MWISGFVEVLLTWNLWRLHLRGVRPEHFVIWFVVKPSYSYPKDAPRAHLVLWMNDLMWQWGAESTSRCWWLWWRLDMGKLYIHLDAKQLMFTWQEAGDPRFQPPSKLRRRCAVPHSNCSPARIGPMGIMSVSACDFAVELNGGAVNLKEIGKERGLAFLQFCQRNFGTWHFYPKLCKISLNSCGAIESKLRADAKTGSLLVLYIFPMGKPEV